MLVVEAKPLSAHPYREILREIEITMETPIDWTIAGGLARNTDEKCANFQETFVKSCNLLCVIGTFYTVQSHTPFPSNIIPHPCICYSLIQYNNPHYPPAMLRAYAPKGNMCFIQY